MLVRSRTMENHSCVRPTPNVAVCGPGERLTHAARMGDKAKPLVWIMSWRLCCESANDNSPLRATLVCRSNAELFHRT